MDPVTARLFICSRVPSIQNLHHAGVFEEAFPEQIHAGVHDSCLFVKLHNNENLGKFMYHCIVLSQSLFRHSV